MGSLRAKMKPGHIVFPDQFIDWTRHRVVTFHDRKGNVVHTPMADPLASAGANFDTNDGRLASSRLTAAKNVHNSNPSAQIPLAPRYRPSTDRPNTAMAPRNTGFIRP